MQVCGLTGGCGKTGATVPFVRVSAEDRAMSWGVSGMPAPSDPSYMPDVSLDRRIAVRRLLPVFVQLVAGTDQLHEAEFVGWGDDDPVGES